MISIKKITTVAAAAVLSFGLFAQTEPVSKTNVATAGLFGNDVDDFTNVNYWSNVAPKQYFAYFGMGSDFGYEERNPIATYNLGFAKQFKKFYWGTYFSGNLGENTTTKTTVGGTTEKKNETKDSEFQFNNTFGFGNVGLGFDFYYRDRGSNRSEENSSINERLNLAFKAGLKEYKVKKTKIIPFAKLSFDIDGVKTKNNTTTNDQREWTLGLEAGADIPFGKDKNVEQTFNVALGMALKKPADSDKKESHFGIIIPVGYKAIVKASNALSVGFSANLESKLVFGKLGDASTFDFDLTPSIAAGVTYATKKNIDLNAGIKFAVPKFTYKKSEVTSTSTWDGNDAQLGFNSGFAIKPTKNICIDCSYEILADIFGDDTNTDLSTYNNFWQTVNQVLVHNIGFEVSVKF